MSRFAPSPRLHGGPVRIARDAWLPWAGVVGLVALVAVVPVAVTTRSNIALLALAGIMGLVAIVMIGPELCICFGLLIGLGLAPFLDPVRLAAGGIPIWLFGFALAAMVMFAVFAIRALEGASASPVQPSVLLWLLFALLAFTVIRFAQSSPMDTPSLAAPFVVLPLAALLTFAWLLHDDALVQLQRVLPIVIALVTAWALMYIAGAGGCGACQQWVSTYGTGRGCSALAAGSTPGARRRSSRSSCSPRRARCASRRRCGSASP